MGDTNTVRLKVLPNLCEIAQKSFDTSTNQVTPYQIKQTEGPNENLSSQQFCDCLRATFGEIKQTVNIDELPR